MPFEGENSSGEKSMDSIRFHELLAQLSQQHDKEVSYLYKEIESLRSLAVKSQDKQNGQDQPKAMPEPPESGPRSAGLAPTKDTVETWNDAESIIECASPALSEAAPRQEPSQKSVSFAEKAEAKDTTENIQGFDLVDAWTKVPVASGSWGHDLDKLMVTSQAHQLVDSLGNDDEPGEAEAKAKLQVPRGTLSAFHQMIIINPASQGRVMWDVAGMFLIAWDMLSIPVFIAFEPEPNGFVIGMAWLTLLFWTTDILFSICTGYYQEGKLIMRQTKIIKNYVKFWFWVDMIVVVPDWVMKVMGSMTSVAGLGRILRAARVMRVLRMLRLLKLKKLFALVYDLIDSEYMWIVFSLIRLLTLLLVMNHIVACAWYLCGRLSGKVYSKNWLEDVGHTPVKDEDLLWKYLTSLHWSITQFTPASMDISATNSAERIFSIAILFWALVALSSVIGNVSASMTALRNMSSDEMQKFWMLRRYFKQKRISRDLAERIIKYLEYEVASKKDVVPVLKVVLLRDISENLKLELANEMNGPLLSCHPFFSYVSEEIPAMMFRLCHLALRSVAYATDDVAFFAGDEGQLMYFFKVGLYEYMLADGHVVDTSLGPKTWASEAVLWTAWRHRGTLTALKPSEVTEVVPSKFVEVFRMHPRPWNLGRQYGAQFVEYMNCINRTALTDIIFDTEIFAKLMMGWSRSNSRAESEGTDAMKPSSDGRRSKMVMPLDSPARSDKVAWQ